MQKNFLHIITACSWLLTAGLASSCKKLIAIPPAPPNQIPESHQFADSASAMAAVAEVYSYNSEVQVASQFGFSNGKMIFTTALSSDELSYTGTSDPDLPPFYSYQLNSLNGDISTLWSTPYSALYNVNAVIANVDGNPALSASFQKQVLAEMKVVRAFYYLNLVNLFGDVPMVTTTNYQTNASLARASVDSVYGRIIADLTDAQDSLTTSYPSAGHIRPNVYVADALLARTYLYRQQWQSAYDAANTVISSNLYSLVTDPNKVFLDGSTEALWQIPALGAYGYGAAEALNFIPGGSGVIPTYLVSSNLLNAFETGDLRQQDWLGTSVVSGQTLYYPYKYKNRQAAATTEDYMIIRLAELYLIRAEASAELGNLPAALTDVNMVRTRAGLGASTADPTSQPDVLNAIMHERQVELFTEWGHRWYDLKRTGMAGTVLSAEKTGWTADAALYPLPQGDLQNDVNLKQNHGYN